MKGRQQAAGQPSEPWHRGPLERCFSAAFDGGVDEQGIEVIDRLRRALPVTQVVPLDEGLARLAAEWDTPRRMNNPPMLVHVDVLVRYGPDRPTQLTGRVRVGGGLRFSALAVGAAIVIALGLVIPVVQGGVLILAASPLAPVGLIWLALVGWLVTDQRRQAQSASRRVMAAARGRV